MSGLSPPPTKRRKSRFGPQPVKSSLDNELSLLNKQNAALAIAAKLSSEIGSISSQLTQNQANNQIAPISNPFIGNTIGMNFMNNNNMLTNNSFRNGQLFGKLYEEKIYIPQEDYQEINFIGLILGPKGLNQKRMQAETGCRILVKGKGASKDYMDPSANEPLHVYISADTPEKIQRGIRKINDLVRESTDQYVEGGMAPKEYVYATHIDIEIPNSQIGVVIGKQGQNLHRIQDTSGATIIISPENVPSNPLMKMITIEGNPQQCQRARNEVYQTIQELHQFRARLKQKQQRTKDRGDVYSAVQPPSNANIHPYFSNIGTYVNNEQYNMQQQLNQTSILGSNFSSDHKNYATSAFDPAFQYPPSLYSDADLPVVHSGSVENGFCEVLIANNVVGLIIGKNASNVKLMKDRTRCDIRVQKDEETLPNSNTRLVALRGCPQSIQAARQEIAKVAHMSVGKQQQMMNDMKNSSPAPVHSYPPNVNAFSATHNMQAQMYHQNPMVYQQMMYAQQQQQWNPVQYNQHIMQQQQWMAAQAQVQTQAVQHTIPPPPPSPNAVTGVTSNVEGKSEKKSVSTADVSKEVKVDANVVSGDAKNAMDVGLQTYLQQCASTYGLTVQQLQTMYFAYYEKCLQYYQSYNAENTAEKLETKVVMESEVKDVAVDESNDVQRISVENKSEMSSNLIETKEKEVNEESVDMKQEDDGSNNEVVASDKNDENVAGNV